LKQLQVEGMTRYFN